MEAAIVRWIECGLRIGWIECLCVRCVVGAGGAVPPSPGRGCAPGISGHADGALPDPALADVGGPVRHQCSASIVKRGMSCGPEGGCSWWK